MEQARIAQLIALVVAFGAAVGACMFHRENVLVDSILAVVCAASIVAMMNSLAAGLAVLAVLLLWLRRSRKKPQ